MANSVFPAPAAGSKTQYRLTLTSGTSWTVPTGVTYVNVALYGGGGYGGQGYWSSSSGNQIGSDGTPGQVRHSIVNTTPGASITYAIGAAGGTTTFTGATSAIGGNNGSGNNGESAGAVAAGYGVAGGPGGGPGVAGMPAGGAGCIVIEYWV